MSTSYYIVRKSELKKKERIEKDSERIKERIEKTLKSFAVKHDIEDLVEDSMDNILSKLKYSILEYEVKDECKICLRTGGRIIFYLDYGIKNVQELRDFLEKDKDLVIVDEYMQKYTFVEFLKNIDYKKFLEEGNLTWNSFFER